MSLPGNFITLEGGEGVGKSTQAQNIQQFLQAQGYDVHLTREPGGCTNAELIRNFLVQGDTGRWDVTSEYLLFSAARREHLLSVVLPALKQGTWVICDRFYDSSRAYQGAGHGLDSYFMDTIYQKISNNYQPNLTFIFDLPVSEGLQRTRHRQQGEDRFERMATDFHERVRQAFLNIAIAEPQRCRIIDASQSVYDVFRQIKHHLQKFIANVGLI